MVYSCSNEVCNIDKDMTDVPLVYCPLSSFIDRDNQVDLELACLSNMSITVVFVPNINIHPVLLNFISNLFGLDKKDIDRDNLKNMPFLLSMDLKLLIRPTSLMFYHLHMSTSSKFIIL